MKKAKYILYSPWKRRWRFQADIFCKGMIKHIYFVAETSRLGFYMIEKYRKYIANKRMDMIQRHAAVGDA